MSITDFLTPTLKKLEEVGTQTISPEGRVELHRPKIVIVHHFQHGDCSYLLRAVKSYPEPRSLQDFINARNEPDQRIDPAAWVAEHRDKYEFATFSGVELDPKATSVLVAQGMVAAVFDQRRYDGIRGDGRVKWGLCAAKGPYEGPRSPIDIDRVMEGVAGCNAVDIKEPRASELYEQVCRTFLEKQ